MDMYNTDEDNDGDGDDDSVYSTTSHPSTTRTLDPIRKKLAKYILRLTPITTRLIKNIDPIRKLLNNQRQSPCLKAIPKTFLGQITLVTYEVS